MGWFGQLLGHDTQVDGAAIEKELDQMLGEGETVKAAFRLIRDLMVFTDRRLILIDKQGITGRRREMQSIPDLFAVRLTVVASAICLVSMRDGYYVTCHQAGHASSSVLSTAARMRPCLSWM